MRFEWDPEKADANHIKHGVTFREAVTVFFDPLAATFEDEEHSENEPRFVTIGYTIDHRLIVVSHTDRGDSIRIISARPATSRERRKHENQEIQ